ncbi:MAG TPA: hypothetical protein VKP60_11170 [Magnetospirillaceae bacterium]|nr:hypothetical protein [Magnetospirillaceae bacterium]
MTANPRRVATSTLLCALAFNLTFFWQELWLVIPKALTPGLHPILFHNNHDWTGTAPTVELLQGTGAIATLASGLVFLALSRRGLFCFWMAFEGLFQSLSQLVLGTRLPGNDVGRALAYLGLGEGGRMVLLALAVMAMAAAGIVLARDRPPLWEAVAAALLAILLIIPFRLPRNLIEVLLIPVIVQVCGLVFLSLGACLARSPAPTTAPALAGPALALAILLAIFQLVLRPGIAF